MSPNLQTSFWERNGLEDKTREVFTRAVQDLYPNYNVEEMGEQGYCSFTLVVSNPPSNPPTTTPSDSHVETRRTYSRHDRIIQLRPEKHSLHLLLTSAARETYGSLAPCVVLLPCAILPPQLHAFAMDRMPGTPYSKHQIRRPRLSTQELQRQTRLIKSFACFIAKAWPSARHSNRADSPVADTELQHPGPSPARVLSQCTGKVGAQIVLKLQNLAQHLPQSLRTYAAETLRRVHRLGSLPVVLNHGDLIPSNMLFDPRTWELSGVVDWAEAEFLPFGTCLYGLEHLLGYHALAGSAGERFVQYEEAPRLREVFWETLCTEAPGSRPGLDDVRVARDLGVLLWYGYAWDEGSIDRVVNERDDWVEVQCLRMFLGVTG